MMKRKAQLGTLIFAAGASLLTGCSDGDQPPAIQSRVALEPFDSCDDLETYIEDLSVQIMRNQLTGDYYGWRGGRGEVLADSAAPQASGAEANKSAPDNYTKTNTQVAGVDEADFMKTNGTHVFVLSGDFLYIAKTWPASEMERLAAVEIEGYARDMFLDEERNRLVVMSYVNAPSAVHRATKECLYYRCGDVWEPATKVTVLNIANPAQPRLASEVYLPGWQQNSRRIDGSVRVVLQDSFRWPEEMRWYPEYNEELWNDEAALRREKAKLADRNEEILRKRSLRDWLPFGVRRLEDGTLVNLEYECTDFHKTNASVYLGFTTVATIDLDNLDRAPERTSIVANTNEIYSTTESLYLATRHWWWWPMPGEKDHTYLFKFDVSKPDSAIYVAAGGVDGHILDQFSMDEHKGYLRLGTTINHWVPDTENPENRWGRLETTNKVSVIRENAGRLDVIGETEEIARGERITSSRFIGDKGYVVTFEQIDPFFTVDLSNPTSPRIVGELKIPGFSSYIHPLDENHVLTIGVYLPEPDSNGNFDWQERRMKLSVFDVSDFENPRESAQALVGTAYGWSAAGWDHKAFNYFPEKGLLAIPFSDYRPNTSGDEYWGSFVSELRVFSISPTRIQPKGTLTMSDIYRTYQYGEWSWTWSPWISRSVIADDFVYAISDAGIRAAHVDSMEQTIGTVTFELPEAAHR